MEQPACEGIISTKAHPRHALIDRRVRSGGGGGEERKGDRRCAHARVEKATRRLGTATGTCHSASVLIAGGEACFFSHAG
jgi:hypothetical protein